MSYTSDRRWYADRNGNATDDPEKGVRLIVGEGGILEDDEAERYGLNTRKRKADVQTSTETKEVKEAPETKDVKGPAASKAKGRK